MLNTQDWLESVGKVNRAQEEGFKMHMMDVRSIQFNSQNTPQPTNRTITDSPELTVRSSAPGKLQLRRQVSSSQSEMKVNLLLIDGKKYSKVLNPTSRK